MPYIDATAIDGSQYSYPVQCFVSPDMFPYDAAVSAGQGFVVGYLPSKVYVIGAWRVEMTQGGNATSSVGELKVGGSSIAANRLYEGNNVVEIKRTNASGMTSSYAYVIEYLDLTANTGLGYLVKQPAIASDGTIAVRK